MPYTRPLKRRKAMKRTYMRARPISRKKSLALVHPARGLVAKKTKTILRYATASNISLPTGADYPTTVKFRVNGLYDPEEATGGHQPRGFDEMTALYKRYRVTRACIEVWATMPEDTEGGLLTVRMTNDSTNANTTDSVLEDPECVITKGHYQSGTMYLRKEVDLQKYFVDFDNDDYVGICATGNPINQYFFHVTPLFTGTGGSSGAMRMTYRITYEAEFFDPQTPNSS